MLMLFWISFIWLLFQWFPMAYYGNARSGGKNGHYYHVFNTPLYYNLPPDALL
jgi:hypothetical protein